MKKSIELTQEESIELLQQKITKAIVEANLPISIAYHVLNSYFLQIQSLYQKRQREIEASLFNKLESNERINSFNQIEEELKQANPNFKVTMREKGA